ncbi:Serine/threonine protein kinase [Streptomyces zhaozhouensis]|uniref:Serine/threonine protein kinase n=1 Tax=Streptomyces zhaozhouensis TaxID=1300267 RepID=A0A286DUY7_9ACTN|nr:serine/threonine-protein kinase [Streptomyces zhaozhouensis]SOD62476.1 Serine/threonine protein kinase [Streptomyces zhaozhouensis]
MKPLGPTDPQRVGQYRLLGKLGAGGMGSVYLARSDRGRTVAVKLVQPELARQPEFRQRFQQEVDAARRVGGDWTAPVLDGDTEAATPWVATGYVAGPSLHEVVATTYGRLPERTLRILANGLVRALRDIHAAGLVHRDLKPSNVMITIDGPRVIDFGIARALEATNEGLTRTGAAVGSPGFMSPEQCRGETLSAASDIFCLGSVLTFAATGHTPFGDANSAMTALMLRIVQNQQDLTEVPEGIRPLIEACLAPHPAERPTLEQLLEATEAPEDDEPWLPGALVAKLGRHAVELLDSEDPMHTPPPPGAAPTPVMPNVPPTPAPPGHAPPTPTQLGTPSTPPPSPQPNGPVDAMATMTSNSPPAGYGPPGQSGYGYPQQGQGGYGYPQQGDPNNPYGGGYGGYNPQGGPAGPGGPGGKKNNQTLWIVVAAVAVLAVVAGVAVFALGGDSDDEADGKNGPTTEETGSADPTEDPTEDPEPTEDPTEGGDIGGGGGESGRIPTEMAGAWEGEMTTGQGEVFYQRIEVSEGSTGQIVTTQYTALEDVVCKESSTLVSYDSVATINSETVEQTWPSTGGCSPWGEQTMEMRGGNLVWSAGGFGVEAEMTMSDTSSGSDAMPYAIFSPNWVGSGMTFDPETSAASGEPAMVATGDGCTWEIPMVAGGLRAEQLIVGPGEVTSGDCDPLPSYRIHWTGPDDPDAITFTPLGDGGGEFVAQRES